MRIAVLGWGSLIWSPRKLKIEDRWKEDGPEIPVEFARISSDGRLTLVIHPESEAVRTLWSSMALRELDEAIQDLAKREGTSSDCIGFVDITHEHELSRFPIEIVRQIRDWTIQKHLDATIWTDLPANFKTKRGVDLTEDSVIEYLRTAPDAIRTKTKEYVTKAPTQVSTKIRRRNDP